MKIVTVTIAFVLLAATVSAECTWVLWKNTATQKDMDPKWSHVSVQDARAACETELPKEQLNAVGNWRDMGARGLQRGEVVNKDSGARIFVRPLVKGFTVFNNDADKPKTWFVIQYYECLLDTLDPRGRRGGAR